MFKQGKKPAFTISPERQAELILALDDAGYVFDRLRLRRRNEVGTFRFPFRSNGDRRQVHVQLVVRFSKKNHELIDVYAHTEPDDKAIVMHTLSALMDGANFQAGSRMLRKHLKEVGFRVS